MGAAASTSPNATTPDLKESLAVVPGSPDPTVDDSNSSSFANPPAEAKSDISFHQYDKDATSFTRRSSGSGSAFAELAVFKRIHDEHKQEDLVAKTRAAAAMFNQGRAEMEQHRATLQLQLDRLNASVPEDTDVLSEEVVVRVEAMLTQERCVVSKMEEMLKAAKDSLRHSRENSAINKLQERPVSGEDAIEAMTAPPPMQNMRQWRQSHESSTSSYGEDTGPTPPIMRRAPTVSVTGPT